MAPITFKLSTLKIAVNAVSVVSNNYNMPILLKLGSLFSVDLSAALLNQLFLIDKTSYNSNPNDVSKWSLGLRLFKLDSTKTSTATTANITASAAGLIRPFPTSGKFIYDNTKVITSNPGVSPVTYAPDLPASTTAPVLAWKTTAPTDVYLVSDAPYNDYTRTVGTDYLTYYVYNTLSSSVVSVNLPNVVVGAVQYINNLESIVQTEIDRILEAYANNLEVWDQSTSSLATSTYNYLFELIKQIEKNDYARITTAANFVDALSTPDQYTISGSSILDADQGAQSIDATDSYGFLFQAGDILQFQVEITTPTSPSQLNIREVVFQIVLI